MNRRVVAALAALLNLSTLLTLGCPSPNQDVPTSRPSRDESSDAANDSLVSMRQAVAKGDWDSAWSRSKDVLVAHSDDPATLAEVAFVAYQTDRKTTATELLVQACRADGFESESRVVQALQAMIEAGKLFDGIDLLREAVRAQPDHHPHRRLLFDLLIGTEQHAQAAVHGRQLVKQRKFDLDLLKALLGQEKRVLESDSLMDVARRSPQDLRPMIGVAKHAVDGGNLDQGRSDLVQILDQHPEFVPAQSLLGRCLALAQRYSDLPAWVERLRGDFQSAPDYWLTLSEWADDQNEPTIASQTLSEAARRDPMHVPAWVKLMRATQSASASIQSVDRDRIQQRADLLVRLRRHQSELASRSDDPVASIIEISQTLDQLGRPWEAEAWCSLGFTLPDLTPQLRNKLEATRSELLKGLNRQTPWQRAGTLPSWNWIETDVLPSMVAKLNGNEGAAEPGQPTTRLPISIVPRLEEESVDRGIRFHGRTADDLQTPGVRAHEMIGCGGGAIDYDLDGWPDLYFVAAGGTPGKKDSASNALFRNRGGGFSDVTSVSGGGDRGFGQGIAVGDVNEDGFDDLVILNYGPNSVWINNGDGSFTDQSDRWMPPSSRWSTSGALADANGDGISDLVVANYCAGMEPATEDCFDSELNGIRACSPNHFPAAADQFLMGTGKDQFDDVTAEWDAHPQSLGRGLGLVIADLDGSPGIEILVANDMTSNHYWAASESPFRLDEIGSVNGWAMDGQARPQGSMGIAIADLDTNGTIDVYVTNYEREYNTLYLNDSNGNWIDSTQSTSTVSSTTPMVGFGTQAIDFDNDGVRELAIVNGHVDDYSAQSRTSRYAQPLQILRREADASYRDVRPKIQDDYLARSHVGRALWTTDLNRDGRLDLVATHQTESAAVLVNHTPTKHRGISIRLVGVGSARTAVGSEIRIRCGNQEAIAAVASGDGFLCSNERATWFGLADRRAPISATVRWPDGAEQTYRGLERAEQWLFVQDQPAPFALR